MWLLAVAAVVVLVVLAEGWRQRRIHGRPSGRPNLAGAGFLELQRRLQPDRKVGVRAAEVAGREARGAEQDDAGAGAGKRPETTSSRL